MNYFSLHSVYGHGHHHDASQHNHHPHSNNHHEDLTFGENFFLSGAAAVVSKSSAAPLERIKLLIQNQDQLLKTGRLKTSYRGLFDCFIRTFRNEGLLAFWRGNLASCIRYFPTQALNFAFKDKLRVMFHPTESDSHVSRFSKNIASGAIAGAMSLCLVYSLDFAQTRLANDALAHPRDGKRQFSGLIDVYRQTLKSDGIRGIYRGFCVSCVGIVLNRGCYFGFYDSLKPLVLGEHASLLPSFMLAYGVTVCAELASYPIDTIRRRMMMTSGETVKYERGIDCARYILKHEGYRSFLKGAATNVLKGVTGASVLVRFDKFKEMYVSMFYDD